MRGFSAGFLVAIFRLFFGWLPFALGGVVWQRLMGTVHDFGGDGDLLPGFHLPAQADDGRAVAENLALQGAQGLVLLEDRVVEASTCGGEVAAREAQAFEDLMRGVGDLFRPLFDVDLLPRVRDRP